MMRKMWMWCIVAALGLSVNYACSDSNKDKKVVDPEEMGYHFELLDTEIEVSAVATDETIHFVANEKALNELKTQSDQDWVTLGSYYPEVIDEGAEDPYYDCYLSVSVAENTSGDDREAKVNFSTSAFSYDCTIKQAGTEIEVEDLATCEVSEVSISVPAEGGEITFITKTDVEFEVSTEVEWITITSDGRAVEEYTVVAEVAANEESATRTGIITVQFMDDNATVKEVNVVQSGVPVSADGVITVEVHATGSTTVYAPAEIEEYLDVTLDELEDGAVTDGEVYYYGINHDGTMYDGDWTTNAVGYWYNTDEDVCEWGEPDPYGTGAERLAYLEGDGYYFSLGFEDHDAYVGETITLRGMYVHGDYSVEVDYVVYVEEKEELPEQESDFEVHVDMINMDYNYVEYELSDYFSLSYLAAAIEVSDIETAILSDDAYVTAYGSDGDLISYDALDASYTASSGNGEGWWFDASGQVTAWGSDSHTYIEDWTGYYDFTYGGCGIMDDVTEETYLTYLAYVNANDETIEPQLVKFYIYIDPVEVEDIPDAKDYLEFDMDIDGYNDAVTTTIPTTYLTSLNNLLGCDCDNASVYMWNEEGSTLSMSDASYNYVGVLPDLFGYDASGPTDSWYDEFGPCYWADGPTICMKLDQGDHHTFETFTYNGTGDKAMISLAYENMSDETVIRVYISAEAK